MYVKISNGAVEQYPFTVEDFRRDNPHTSFPKNIGRQLLSKSNVYPVTFGVKPEYDTLVQTLVPDFQPVLEGVTWKIGYAVVSKPQGEAEAAIRDKRDHLLSDTDKLALSDRPAMSSGWLAYRQELRDITDQEGFPYSVIFPTKPE